MDRFNQSPLDGSVGPRRVTTFEPGSTFGEYTIVRRIGRGGQGSVFEVRDGLGLNWALKVSEEMALQDANAEMRFAREARCVAESLSQLPRHSGVFVGEHYGVWDRRFYVKMKLLRGESLAQRLRRLGQLSIYEAVRLAERIAFAIGQAHEMGVLHRDLKPENVFLTDQGEVVVLDWGCLQLIEAGQQKTTLRGVVCTPDYAPIEQYLATTALNLTPAVDLYALGVILYEALAGYHPFLNWSRAALNRAAAAPAPSQGTPPKSAGNPLGTVTASSGPGLDFKDGRERSNSEGTPYADGSEQGSLSTVRVPHDVFAAQTERHVVPPELLSHLRGIVTGGVTWRSAPDKSTATRPWDPHGTQPTQSMRIAGGASRPRDDSSATSQRSGWTVSERRPPVAGATRTMPRVNAAALDANNAVANADVAPSARASAEARAPKGEVPRRFSVIEVLTFQERVKPRPIDGIPPKLGALVLRLLAKRPTDRPQDALEVSEQLRALLPQLRDAPAEFAASTPEHNSRYLTRALLWIRLRQNGTRWAWAAAGIVAAGFTGAVAYSGMATTRAAPVEPVTVVYSEQRQLVASEPERTRSSTTNANPVDDSPSPMAPLPSPVDDVVAAAALPAARTILSAEAPLEASPRLAPPAAKKKRRRSEGVDSSKAAPAANVPPAESTTSAPSPCVAPCDNEPAGEARNPRLQAKPNAVLRRSSNQLWLE